ncbi:hypothetical protein EV379_2804 [Microterricola gilva]|uniref:Uncharacterized protein n=2 Tax=Microterricola gilva TaxID=393267 RepID=A0A4Q8AP93_9MICO|nr:hypothetical protein EV379_2804 [Microterricola gilva]
MFPRAAGTATSLPLIQNGGMTSRTPRRWVVLVLGILAAWLLGAVVVRLGLDWADTYPYSPASEIRYLVIAGVALTIAFGGSIASVLWVRRGRKTRR